MHVPLASEFDYYIRNREKLCGEHEGEYVVIKGGTVLDFFPRPGRCHPGDSPHTRTGYFPGPKVRSGSEKYGIYARLEISL